MTTSPHPATPTLCQLCGNPLHQHVSTDVHDNPLPPQAECVTDDCPLKSVTLLLTAFPLSPEEQAACMLATARIEARMVAARARWALEDATAEAR